MRESYRRFKMRTMMWGFVFLLLCLGFYLLFYEIDLLNKISVLLKRTKEDMDAASRQRILEDRKQLMELRQKHSLLFSLEQMLQYSGLKNHMPGLTVEWWLAVNTAVLSGAFLGIWIFAGLMPAVAAVVLLAAAEAAAIRAMRTANLRRVNNNLMKLLDFLGNYSVTAAEATSVFSQVSRYMEEPLSSVLDACSAEAQITGDASLALLSMAEKIEHPKFKELARNMEISVRYSADFSALVISSRRSLREYLRVSQERRGMLREAAVNMALLLGMSFVVLLTVGHLTEVSLWTLLAGTVPGRVGACILLVIFGLFAGQFRKAQC